MKIAWRGELIGVQQLNIEALDGGGNSGEEYSIGMSYVNVRHLSVAI
jgi:hypothetical protein